MKIASVNRPISSTRHDVSDVLGFFQTSRYSCAERIKNNIDNESGMPMPYGNCLFRSVRTESRHAQIRALAIQHLINELRRE